MSRLFDVRINIAKFLEFIRNVKSCSPLTIKAYKGDLEQVFEYEERSEKLTPAQLLEKVREAQKKWARLTPASRNRKAATLKSLFSWAFEEQLLDQDLSFQVHAPKIPKKIPHFISVDEVVAVLKSFEIHPSPSELRNQTLFLVLYGGGLRITEACSLKWNQINWDSGTLRLLGKGQKERLAALPSKTLESLQRLQKKKSASAYVFGEAQPLDSRQGYEIIRRWGQRAQLLQPLHPHALRHSFATHMLTSGVNLRILQQLLGHESLVATEKYTHLGIDQLARTLESKHPLGSGSKRSR